MTMRSIFIATARASYPAGASITPLCQSRYEEEPKCDGDEKTGVEILESMLAARNTST
jgi:hypothetical protein